MDQPDRLTAAALKERQRPLSQGTGDDRRTQFGLRTHRAISWLRRAESEPDSDPDVGFILRWIGFNALYATEPLQEQEGQRAMLNRYITTVTRHDPEAKIGHAMVPALLVPIGTVIRCKHLFVPFWSHQRGQEGAAGWEDRLTVSIAEAEDAVRKNDIPRVLLHVLSRLLLLRNQLVHGLATWQSGENRAQLRAGAAVMTALLPVLIELMLDDPDADWGRCPYPVVD